MTTYRLERDAESLRSLTSDGDLLARDAAVGESTTAFTKAHGHELAKEIEALADVVRSTRPAPGLERKTRTLAALAETAAGELERLAASPSQRAVARKVRSRLGAVSAHAEELEKSR